jgi:hypothetical protein
VLFKLDIDNFGVEAEIVRQLLASPETMALIDEFIWEHHVDFQPMIKHWCLLSGRERVCVCERESERE